MSKSQRKLIIFAKAPVSGYSKTRLSRTLGGRKAASIARKQLEKTVKKSSQSQVSSIALWCAPDTRHKLFIKLAKQYCISLYQQMGVCLGERMSYALCKSLKDAQSVVLIGTDSPDINSLMINKAFHYLEKNIDVVIGPVTDGGYFLIGMKQCHSVLFENISWGTERVYQQTLDILLQENFKYYALKPVNDLDRGADLHLLR